MSNETGSSALDRLAIALDTSDWSTFEGWCAELGPQVGVLKVGLEAYLRWGPKAVAEARRHGRRVFLDLKLHDIPNTVKGAVGAARAMGVDFLTVHASGGSAMLEAAGLAAGDELAILAVTVLTHLDEAELAKLDLPGTSLSRAQGWAEVARDAGCAGAVCSPLEVAAIRECCSRPFLLVTPGVRLAGATQRQDDQHRVATPKEALGAGADLLVVGRPVTRAPDMEAALAELAREMEASPP